MKIIFQLFYNIIPITLLALYAAWKEFVTDIKNLISKAKEKKDG